MFQRHVYGYDVEELKIILVMFLSDHSGFKFQLQTRQEMRQLVLMEKQISMQSQTICHEAIQNRIVLIFLGFAASPPTEIQRLIWVEKESR